MTRRLLVALVFAAACSSMVVFAQNAHFQNVSASIITSGQVEPNGNAGELAVSFKEAGLGNAGTEISYTATAQAQAVYGCINKGGNHPQASNKTGVAGPVSGQGTFPVGRNGSISATITIDPPATTLTCPGNMTEVLVSVSYSDVTLTDTFYGDYVTISGTFSHVFFQ